MKSADEIYCSLIKMDLPHNPDFDFRYSVTDVKQHDNPRGADELSVIIPPWHANTALQIALAERHRKVGRDVIRLELDDDILSSDAERTVRCFESVATDLDKALERVDRYKKVHWVGTSLGTSVMMTVLGIRDYPVDSITAITTSGDLASSMWTGVRTQPLRERFEEQGVNLPMLQRQWLRLSTTFQARKIHDASAHLVISDADRVIESETAYKFADALRESGNDVLITRNKHLGHYATIVKHSLSGLIFQA